MALNKLMLSPIFACHRWVELRRGDDKIEWWQPTVSVILVRSRVQQLFSNSTPSICEAVSHITSYVEPSDIRELSCNARWYGQAQAKRPEALPLECLRVLIVKLVKGTSYFNGIIQNIILGFYFIRFHTIIREKAHHDTISSPRRGFKRPRVL